MRCYHFRHEVFRCILSCNDVIMEHNGDNEMDTYVLCTGELDALLLSLLDVELSSPYYHIKTKYNNIFWISKSKRKSFIHLLEGLC